MPSISAIPGPRQPDLLRACVHDLRNLFAVVAAAKFLLDRPSDERTLTTVVDALCRVAADGKALTDRLLAGGMEDRACGTDAHDEMQNLASIVRALEGPTLKIELSLDPGPAWILMEPSEFRAVVLELITNSARAGAHTIKVRTAPRGGRLWLTVADDGSGFADAAGLPALAPLGGLHGTGLHRLASAVGAAHGKVRIRSRQAQGSVVALTLPIIGQLPPLRQTQALAARPSRFVSIRESIHGKRSAH